MKRLSINTWEGKYIKRGRKKIKNRKIMSVCQCLISEIMAAVFAYKLSGTVIPQRQITAFSMLSLRCYHWGKCACAVAVALRCWLSLCSYQCSVSDVVFGVEGSPFTADGSLIQCVSIWLTIVVVHREIFHVYWLLGHQGLQNTDAMYEFKTDKCDKQDSKILAPGDGVSHNSTF